MDDDGLEIKPSDKELNHKSFRWLVNHSKKEYIDLTKIEPDILGYKIHPLSLLVCEGNGRGGGDFHGEDSRIGTWARDVVSLEIVEPKNFKLVNGQFKEE